MWYSIQLEPQPTEVTNLIDRETLHETRELPNSLPFNKINWFNLGFEVLTAVSTKNSNFWDITPFSRLKANRRFGGTCGLTFQCLRIS
jgi:hypothetical protein